MSGVKPVGQIPPENRERLILILYPKRIGFLIYYVFGSLLIIISLFYNIATTAGWTVSNEVTWFISMGGIAFGILIITIVETRRRFTLHILTTWNVRIRTGIVKRKTVRVFYDDITHMETSSNPEERKVGVGHLKIYSRKVPDEPALVWKNVFNPDGLKEIIQRFIETTPEPPPWSHLDY